MSERSLLRRPVQVPPDFVGMHAHRWPVGDPLSPAPTYMFGAVRSHDFDGASWNSIHTGLGRFRWDRLDAWVTAHAAAGRTLLYTIYGTPAWAAASAANKDAYGQPGGASPPRDLRTVQEFVTVLLARYNGDGVSRIHLIEMWNEPRFTRETRDFWWGTAEELATLGRVVYLAAKVVDPHVQVLSPGFAGNLAGSLRLQTSEIGDARSSPMYQFLTASDGQGGTGARWCDGLAFHCYNAPLAGENYGFLLEIQRVQTMLDLMQIRLPLFDTEFGFLPETGFARLSSAEKAPWLRRLAVLQAALGVRALFLYAHDDDLVGNPSVHPEVAEAIGDIHAMIAGKTLQQVSVLPDGAVRVRTVERTFLW